MTNTNKPTTIIVALNKLDRDPKNVCKTYRKEGIEELAANLRSDGYQPLQNLVVRKGDKKGRYFGVATRLVQNRTWPLSTKHSYD
ncbi:hypothetical protein [Brucella pituitosa]|uniref:hypothetical protein n=1 Tax=Brucella pituitosa TaxID=571256 RepID=UPI003F4AE748